MFCLVTKVLMNIPRIYPYFRLRVVTHLKPCSTDFFSIIHMANYCFESMAEVRQLDRITVY